MLGGTGHYGRQIVASLVARSQPVRVLSRNAEGACRVVGEKPEIVAGDITATGSITRGLDGARAVVVAVSAASRKDARNRLRIERDGVLELLARAAASGVSRIVYLSGYDVREEYLTDASLLAFARPMLEVEAALAASSLNWTVLGCAASMELFFALIRGDTMTVPGGGPPALPTIAACDVGEIAAQAATRDDLARRRLRLTGPEALSLAEAARRIGEVWGRPIRYRPIPLFPLRVAAALSRPVFPYLHFLSCAVRLMNQFPPDLAAAAPQDHRHLQDLFDYSPTTLEMEAARRSSSGATPGRAQD